MTYPILTIVVHGTPAPQGSKRAFRNQHTGRIHQVESSAAVAPWRQDVKHAALAAIEHLPAIEAGALPLDGPIAVSMVFVFVRPKSHWRTGRNAHLLSDRAPTWPAGRPDLSKLVRSTEDALSDVVWNDDAQIVRCEAIKRYCSEDGLLGMASAGAVITVWVLSTDRGILVNQEGTA